MTGLIGCLWLAALSGVRAIFVYQVYASGSVTPLALPNYQINAYDSLTFQGFDSPCASTSCTWTFYFGNIGQTIVATSNNPNGLCSMQFVQPQTIICNVTVSVNGGAPTTSTEFLRLTIVARPTGTMSFTPAITTIGAAVSLTGIVTSGGTTPLQYTFSYVNPPASRTSLPALSIVTSNLLTVSTSVTFAATDLWNGAATGVEMSLVVLNGEGGSSFNIYPAANLTVNPAPVTAISFPAVTTVGATVHFAVSASLGTPGYTFLVVVLYSNGAVADASLPTATGSPGASVPYVFAAAKLTGGAPTVFEAQLSASDSVGVSAPTITSPTTITVNPAAVVTASWGRAVTTATANTTFFGAVVWGTAPYTYAFTVTASDLVTPVAAILPVLTTPAVTASAWRVFTTGDLNVVSGNALPTAFGISLTVTDAAGVARTFTNASTFVVNPAPTASALAASPALTTVGVSVTISAAVTAGTPPYSYAFYVLTPSSLVLAALTPVVTSATTASSSYSFSQLQLTAAQTTTFGLEVIVTDAVGVATSPLINAAGVTVNPLPVAVVSVSPSPCTAGAAVTLSGSVTSGTSGGFSYKWTVLASDGVTVVDASVPAVATTLRATSQPYTFAAVATATTYVVQLIITDFAGAASLPATTTVVVNPAPTGAATATPSAVTVGVNVTLDVTGLTGGTAPFSVQWSILSPSGGVVATLGTGSPNAAEYYAFTSSELAGALSATFVGRATLLDAAGYSLVLSTTAITVNAPPAVQPTSVQAVTDSGVAYVFTAATLGGTAPIALTWTVRAASGTVVATVSGTTLSGGLYAFPSVATASRYSVTVQGVDAVGVVSASVAGLNVTVNPLPTAVLMVTPFVTTVSIPVTLFVSGLAGGTPGVFSFAYSFNNSFVVANTTGVLSAPSPISSTTAPGPVNHTFVDADLVPPRLPALVVAGLTITDSVGGVSSRITAATTFTLNPRPTGVIQFSPASLSYGANVTLSCLNATGGTGNLVCLWTITTPGGGAVVDATLPPMLTQGGAAMLPWTFKGSLYAAGTAYGVQLVVIDSLGARSNPIVAAQAVVLIPPPMPPVAPHGLTAQQLAVAIAVPIGFCCLLIALAILLYICCWRPRRQGKANAASRTAASQKTTKSTVGRESAGTASTRHSRFIGAGRRADGSGSSSGERSLVTLFRDTYRAIGAAKQSLRDEQEQGTLAYDDDDDFERGATGDTTTRLDDDDEEEGGEDRTVDWQEDDDDDEGEGDGEDDDEAD